LPAILAAEIAVESVADGLRHDASRGVGGDGEHRYALSQESKHMLTTAVRRHLEVEDAPRRTLGGPILVHQAMMCAQRWEVALAFVRASDVMQDKIAT